MELWVGIAERVHWLPAALRPGCAAAGLCSAVPKEDRGTTMTARERFKPDTDVSADDEECTDDGCTHRTRRGHVPG